MRWSYTELNVAIEKGTQASSSKDDTSNAGFMLETGRDRTIYESEGAVMRHIAVVQGIASKRE